MIFLDTHVLVWVYGGHRQRIPTEVQRRMDREELAISPFVRLELAYLYEVGKVTASAETVLADLGPKLELVVADASVGAICETALRLTWTRDPFDRLIAAQASAAESLLLTKDEKIRENLPLAWWGS